ncbi:MAG: TraR/DksA family transcriptional regulator [Thiotrichales bacterium]
MDTEIFRQRLHDELQQLSAAIAGTAERAGTVMLDQSSVGRLSRMDAMQQQAMAKRTQTHLGMRERKLQAALARIDQGTYGNCCACGTEIEPDRLDADPAAVFCSDCAAERAASS